MKLICLASRGRQSLDLRERPSGSQLGESRPSLGGGRSESLVTYCCIYVMEYCDAGMHALSQVSVWSLTRVSAFLCHTRPLQPDIWSLQRICCMLSLYGLHSSCKLWCSFFTHTPSRLDTTIWGLFSKTSP